MRRRRQPAVSHALCVAAVPVGHRKAAQLLSACAMGLHSVPTGGVGEEEKQKRGRDETEEMGTKVLSGPEDGMVEGKLAGERH